MMYFLFYDGLAVIVVFVIPIILIVCQCLKSATNIKDNKIYRSLLSISMWILVILWSACFIGYTTSYRNEQQYTTIITAYPIDFVKEDSESDRLVYGYHNQQFFQDKTECEIVVIDKSFFSEDVPKDLKFPILPYYQWNRTETYNTIKVFGRKYYGAPTTKDTYRFYVSKDYLEKYNWDNLNWDHLFGVCG